MQTSPLDVRHYKKQKTDNGVNPTHTHSNPHQHLRSKTEIPPPIQINNHNNRKKGLKPCGINVSNNCETRYIVKHCKNSVS